jgi:mannose-1-phosphate guanylyltransferase
VVKAYLLAGGLGERLRPLTLSTPKCLVSVNGVPLLEIWLELCSRSGITDVLLNVSRHAHLVQAFLERRHRPPRVTLVVEEAPRGTAGTVAANRWFADGEQDFWILYADTLTDAPLTNLLAAHRAHTGVLTMALFHAPDPKAAGIVTLGPGGRVIDFVEKPESPASDLANAGIYVARSELFAHIPSGPLVDFGLDVFPGLRSRIYGHVVEHLVLDIGTPEALAAAAEVWRRRRAKRVS